MRDPVALERQLALQVFKMDFFQVLRLIETAHPELPRIGESLRARDDALRLTQNPSLVFHATALSSFTPAEAGRKPKLAVNFFGLTGANAPMPIHFTEYARDRARNSADETLSSFLNIFHHRLLSMFYRARAQAEPAIAFDRAETEKFREYIGSLCGVGSPGMWERDEVGDFAKLHFAGLLATKARTGSGLVSILRAYFDLPIALEQFVGAWLDLPKESLLRLGGLGGTNRLGVSTVLGKRVWDCQSKFRLTIGPLSFDDYQRMLPGGSSMKRLLAWVRSYVGCALDWEVRLILRKEDVPRMRLGSGLRLGQSTWAASGPVQSDRDQLVIHPPSVYAT